MHETTESGKKVKKYKWIGPQLKSIGKQSGESVESVPRKKKRLWWEGLAEKESFMPGMKE